LSAGRRLRSEFTNADDSPGLMLWRVTNRWQAAQRAALKPFGLTHVKFVLLASLSWLGGDAAPTQQQLAEHAGTDPMMASQVLRALERQQLVERLPHPADRRARILRVTPAGADLADRANAAVEACDAEFFAPLADRGTDLLELLRRLVRPGPVR
jgi:DNA-binding MarR family transcriptional regulator